MATEGGEVDVATDAPTTGDDDGRIGFPGVAATLVTVVVVAYSRSPFLLTTGRIYAEEGVFLGHMLAEPGLGSLAFVPERTGYLILFANAATLLAARVPLAQAPLVTVWLSLGVLLALVAIVLRWPSDLFTTRAARLAAAVLLIVGTGAAPEVWLTSINMTTAFGIIALVLLFVRVDDLSRAQWAIAAGVLALAALSGVYAAALAPLFVVVAVTARSRRRWTAAAIVGAAAALQVLLLLRARRAGTLAESRVADLSIDEVARSVGGLHLGGFALGEPAMVRLGDAIDERSWLAAATVALVVLAVVATSAAILWRSPERRVPLLLAAAFAIVEVVVLTGSLTHGAPGRYGVVPITIVTFLLIYGASAVGGTWIPRASTALLAVALVAGLGGFWSTTDDLRCDGCPDWSEQVTAWEAGGPTEVRIWPYRGDAPWTMELPASR